MPKHDLPCCCLVKSGGVSCIFVISKWTCAALKAVELFTGILIFRGHIYKNLFMPSAVCTFAVLPAGLKTVAAEVLELLKFS